MTKVDVIVVGAGSGLDIASFAHRRGNTVAIVEEGPMGGTCLNRGCIPSKMLIHSADAAETIRSSQKFGITSRIQKINFASIVKKVSDYVDKDPSEKVTPHKFVSVMCRNWPRLFVAVQGRVF